MPKRRRKMVNLNIEETSGVDHPAHMSEGWLVMKNAKTEDVEDTFSEVGGSKMTEEQEIDQIVELQDALLNTEARIEDLEKAAKKGYGMKPKEEMDKEDMEDDEEEDKKNPFASKKKKKAKTEDEDEMMKSLDPDVRDFVKALRDEASEAIAKAAAATEELAKERIAKADADAISRVRAWTSLSLDAEKVGPSLRKLNEVDSDLAKSVEEVLTAVNGQAESANIFAEIGNSNNNSGTNAYETLSTMAKAAVTEGKAPTFEQAFVDVATANPALYNQHLAEGR